MTAIVCTDIDGTLLNADHQLSDFTLETLHALVKRDIPVVLASARGPEAMKAIYDQIGSKSPIICYNGALTLEDPHVMPSFLVHEELYYKQVKEVVALCSSLMVHCSIFDIHNWYAPRMDKWAKKESAVVGIKPTIANFEEILHKWKNGYMHAVFKVMCMGEKEAIDELYNKTAVFSEIVHRYRSSDHYLELISRRSDKWLGFEAAAEYLDMDPKDSIAFGDGYNDIRLLTEAGTGVAVANARPEVYEAADFYTARHDEDGVAKFLQKHFEL